MGKIKVIKKQKTKNKIAQPLSVRTDTKSPNCCYEKLSYIGLHEGVHSKNL